MPSCASYVSRTHDVIDDVTRSENKPSFEIAISPSIFELECRSKAQNVGNAYGYLSGIFNFRYQFWNNKHSFNLTSDVKRSSQIMQKNIFHDDDVIDDVTVWPQSRPSLFLYKWKNDSFHDNWKISKDVIIKLPVHRYNEIMTTFI